MKHSNVWVSSTSFVPFGVIEMRASTQHLTALSPGGVAVGEGWQSFVSGSGARSLDLAPSGLAAAGTGFVSAAGAGCLRVRRAFCRPASAARFFARRRCSFNRLSSAR